LSSHRQESFLYRFYIKYTINFKNTSKIHNIFTILYEFTHKFLHHIDKNTSSD
jgi:hypothetical protein